MTVWVVRKSLDGETIGGPRLCAKPGRIAREPGLLTLEELFANFLSEGETVGGFTDFRQWQILKGEQIAGYFEILDGDRFHPPA
jgi:hypothetical protein